MSGFANSLSFKCSAVRNAPNASELVVSSLQNYARMPLWGAKLGLSLHQGVLKYTQCGVPNIHVGELRC